MLTPEERTTTLAALMTHQQKMASHAEDAKRLNLSENHHYFMTIVSHCENAYRKLLSE